MRNSINNILGKIDEMFENSAAMKEKNMTGIDSMTDHVVNFLL